MMADTDGWKPRQQKPGSGLALITCSRVDLWPSIDSPSPGSRLSMRAHLRLATSRAGGLAEACLAIAWRLLVVARTHCQQALVSYRSCSSCRGESSDDIPASGGAAGPASGCLPGTSQGQRFGSFTWRSGSSTARALEIVEFAYDDDARLFVRPSDRARSVCSPIWFTRSTWHWRVWTVNRAGDISLSERRFPGLIEMAALEVSMTRLCIRVTVALALLGTGWAAAGSDDRTQILSSLLMRREDRQQSPAFGAARLHGWRVA